MITATALVINWSARRALAFGPGLTPASDLTTRKLAFLPESNQKREFMNYSINQTRKSELWKWERRNVNRPGRDLREGRWSFLELEEETDMAAEVAPKHWETVAILISVFDHKIEIATSANSIQWKLERERPSLYQNLGGEIEKWGRRFNWEDFAFTVRPPLRFHRLRSGLGLDPLHSCLHYNCR